MERRAFVRTGLAAALFAPGTLSLPEIARRTDAPVKLARLSSNENPLGPSAAARRAIIDMLGEGNRYARRNGEMIARLAAKHAVRPEHIVLGNGSTEILQMTVQAMSVERPARVVIPDPTFEVVEAYARSMGADIVKVPLRADHSHDLERMRDLPAADRGLVLQFICNPNNPTGTLTSCDAIGQWLANAPANVWFLIDEAYFEFAEDPSYRSFIAEATTRPNVIVSRTFSKVYGLAGVRFGYGIGHPDTIKRIGAFAAGTNINQFAFAGALASLDDEVFVRDSLALNARGRRFVYDTLNDLQLPYMPSHANFVFHKVNGELPAYINRMRAAGVQVGRPFPPLLNYNRVSIGTGEEMTLWADALRAFRKQGLA